MDYVALGENVRNERRKQKYTQEQLSEKVGISAVFLSQIETGSKKPSFETIYKIADELHITIDSLINLPDNQTLDSIRINSLLKDRSEKEKQFLYDTINFLLSKIDNDRLN